MSTEDSISSQKPVFNFVYFMKFLEENNILVTSIAAVLSYALRDLTNECINNIVIPIINKDYDNDGVKDLKKIEDTTFTVFGIKFGTGKVFISLIKFFIVLYITFLIVQIIKKTNVKY